MASGAMTEIRLPLDVLMACSDRGASDCRCRDAVLRTYDYLSDANFAESRAFNAALRVYRYHHPEIDAGHARHIVETWLARSAPH